ncbi:MAG: CtsR family transcriptional regulator [Oscillospiraceae bacterium]|jgi:transcriptional regulator CtsR|nr:CtsR family transcriptional regulator [Oscillospiraceae bacterium]
MAISDTIAIFIQDMLEEAEGCAELQRAELAGRFGCVPSQINYVISTRFSPEHGYIVESRRGGGGYIRIRRVSPEPRLLVMHTVNMIGDQITWPCAAAFLSNLAGAGAIDSGSAGLITAALSDRSLRRLTQPLRDCVRADIFKQMLVALTGE